MDNLEYVFTLGSALLSFVITLKLNSCVYCKNDITKKYFCHFKNILILPVCKISFSILCHYQNLQFIKTVILKEGFYYYFLKTSLRTVISKQGFTIFLNSTKLNNAWMKITAFLKRRVSIILWSFQVNWLSQT